MSYCRWSSYGWKCDVYVVEMTALACLFLWIIMALCAEEVD